ncbi:hypothetical protein [Aggregatilinea lenta]|uniref:hypothetical protein n=1 Tax=Aggregatilinea lenta TaxID=913108 RepID=UPI0013C37ADB|nr:hypothetical protein [Aggregatilinea lenta]
MYNKSIKVNIARKHIGSLGSELYEGFDATRADRVQLMDWEDANDVQSSFLSKLTIYEADLDSYARQAANRGKIRNSKELLQYLKANSLLVNPVAAKWFDESGTTCSSLKSYVEKLDYLRLLLIEFIENYEIDAEGESSYKEENNE